MINTIKEKIKALGGTLFSFLIGGIIMLGLFLIPVLFIYGGVKISSIVTPWLFLLSVITLAVIILFLLPLSIFSKTRGFAGSGMVVASFVFGLTLWVWGFILTYILWGWFALFVGIFMMGVGVVPIAMLATMFKGMWPTFWQLVILTTLTFGVRWLGVFFGEKAEERKYKADIDYSNIEMYDEKYNEEHDAEWNDYTMIQQLENKPGLGWNHPNTIYLAFDIVTDFGEILENNGWMIYGVPESLLPASKENVRLAFEVLFRFLHNKNAWDDFRQKYPKVAHAIISNSFYKAMINSIPFIEKFIPDDEAVICVEVAEFMKNRKDEELLDFFKDKNQSEFFFEKQNEIEEKTKELYSYLDSQNLFIKEDIFD